MSNVIKYIDLFSGIGGFRLGLDALGFECVFSSDIDANARSTYEANYGEEPKGDITKIEPKDIPDHDILCAGFPCQPFSISGLQHGFEDTRGTLFFEILKILKEKKTRVVFLENVKHLVHHDKGNTFRVMLKHLDELGYVVSYKILNAKDFGVAQNRERIIIIGLLNEKNEPFDFKRVKRYERKVVINDILEKEGDFEFLDKSDYTLIDNPKEQASGLIFSGYRNKKIRKSGVRPNTEHLSRVHKQPNRIYSARGVHPTLPSQETSGRFFILLNDGNVRKLTILECYRLMGVPDDFIKVSPISEQYKQIGNSIVSTMVNAVGKEIMKQVFMEEKDV